MMIPERPLLEIVRRIDSYPELAGCMVGFHGEQQSRIIQHPSCRTVFSERVVIVIEELATDDGELKVELQRWSDTPGGSSSRAAKPSVVTNRSKLGPELLGAGFSCGLTIVSALGAASGVAAEIPTGGASSFLVVASWIGLRAGALQCANGLVRLGAIVTDLDGSTLQAWDQNAAYSTLSLVVDALGVTAAAGSLPSQLRNLWAVIARQNAFTAANLSFTALRAMNRVQRMNALKAVFEAAARTPSGREALLRAAKEAQIAAKTLERASGLSVRHAASLQRIIGEETVKRLSASLREVVSGAAGMAVSASPASRTGSGSGSLNFVINLIDGGMN